MCIFRLLCTVIIALHCIFYHFVLLIFFLYFVASCFIIISAFGANKRVQLTKLCAK